MNAIFVLVLTACIHHVTLGQDLEGCGETKGCFMQPTGCSGNDCTAYVTWQVQEDGQTRFTMRAQRPEGLQWVAFGLRPSATTSGMSPADVYACTSNSEVRRSENVSPLNSLSRDIPSGSVETVSASSENNVINCVFSRQPDLPGDATFYNISGENKFYILLSIGDAINTDDGSIAGNRHVSRWGSGSAQSLSNFKPLSAESQTLAKAHGALMVIAWIGFATIGITMARFFKPMWPDSTLLSTKVWFTIHRICMVTCVLLTCVAFALIFVHVKGFVVGRNTAIVHGIFGIIVTALGLINPTMALFRPHPGTPNRPIFNWAHWGVGTCAHTAAFVTVFLGIGFRASGLLSGGTPDFAFYTMIAFVGMHILIVVLFEVVRCRTEGKDASDNIPMSASGDTSQQTANPTSNQVAGSMVRTILLFSYITVATVAIIIVIVAIVLSGN